MFPTKATWLALLVGVLSAPAWAQTTIPGGLIDTDMVWTAEGSPYLIEGNVLVAPDTLLQIEPGVEVRFLGNYHFLISGRLLAEGTSDAPIAFMPDSSGGSWERLYFTDFATDDSVLRYCTLDYGRVRTDDACPLFDYCTLLPGGHLYISSTTDVVIRHTHFTEREIHISSAGAGTLVFENNEVHGRGEASSTVMSSEAGSPPPAATIFRTG